MIGKPCLDGRHEAEAFDAPELVVIGNEGFDDALHLLQVFEHPIDTLVYELYDLTDEEIKIVEGAS